MVVVFFAAASLTVISVKAVSGMITESIKGQLQLIYPIFYIMLVVMIASCAFQIRLVKVFFFSVSLHLPSFSNSFPIFFLLQSLALTTNQIPFWPSLSLNTQWEKNILEMVTFHLLRSYTVLKHEYAAVYTLKIEVISFMEAVLFSFLLSSQISQSGDENV